MAKKQSTGKGYASGSKKGPSKGSGGKGRRSLAGKGPTPSAKDRAGHPARRKAGSRPKERRTPEVILGRNAVNDALAAGVPGVELLVLESIQDDDRTKAARRRAEKADLPVSLASRTELERLADGLPHQGIALVIPPYDYTDLATIMAATDQAAPLEEFGTSQPLVVVLDHLQDARNVGAIARSAAAFGADGLVIPTRRAASVTASAWRASAGAFARVPVAREVNIARSLTTLKKAGYLALGLTPHAGLSINDIQGDLLNQPIALVIGSEDVGMSRLVSDLCAVHARIPIGRSTESLNAAVAAGIAMNVIRFA